MGFVNAALFPLFDYVAKNRWLQIVILCVTGLIILRIWLWLHDEKIRKMSKAKSEAETRKTIDRIEEKSDARIEQADRIRASNPVSESDPGMSDRTIPEWNYRDRADNR